MRSRTRVKLEVEDVCGGRPPGLLGRGTPGPLDSDGGGSGASGHKRAVLWAAFRDGSRGRLSSIREPHLDTVSPGWGSARRSPNTAPHSSPQGDQRDASWRGTGSHSDTAGAGHDCGLVENRA
jgi:hypothetical protein